ncbi:AAA-domain-containing protein [Nadsonia fulvescens var. elongata DSM 6958]|uniref:AAA-domain-containing protein n=1 Tax=Nadsonia fulvescens var. elongata DSM 6958 TaxID=857566 RepID=A0A1E3PP45_9ASCO|nr:AAA-domain-containing protein [Nadsonia fulvescens var. elongata DSM 6958]
MSEGKRRRTSQYWKRPTTSDEEDTDEGFDVKPRRRTQISSYAESSSSGPEDGAINPEIDGSEEKNYPTTFPVTLHIGPDLARQVAHEYPIMVSPRQTRSRKALMVDPVSHQKEEKEENTTTAEEDEEVIDDSPEIPRKLGRTRSSVEDDYEEGDDCEIDEDDDIIIRPRGKKPRTAHAGILKKPKRSRNLNDDDDEYTESNNSEAEEEGRSGSGSSQDSDTSLYARGHRNNITIVSDGDDNDDDECSDSPARPLRNTRSRSRNAHRNSSDIEEIDSLSLKAELDEIRKTPPIRRKLLRARKEVNYQLLPPPVVDDLNDDELAHGAVPARRKTSNSTMRRLYPTAGPFGGQDAVSIFGSNIPGLTAIGGNGANDDSSSDEELVPKFIGANGASTGSGSKHKSKNSLADSDPLGVDMNIDFSVVGGLDNHINQLKEMVALPLMYPEIFQRFNVTPPRGVLFHGPPGTGKTLMARALAASCSTEEQKITFYMRKGADCLSKWVGEAERQLRLLFEEAKKNQPSIIFFDEIDGLAPVRSSKQEQIHASIVSTLLALMDGMDNRGQVIVIGATNRPDSVDPALRRPGRFDREFYFPLPDIDARKTIISINTRKWDPPMPEKFIDYVATLTKGYGGADLRALCTEAALNAIQRKYPQIYMSKEKLLIDPKNIHVTARDFMRSIEKITPSSARSTGSGASPLPSNVEPLLKLNLTNIIEKLDHFLPREKKRTALEDAMYEDFDADLDVMEGFDRQNMMKNLANSRVFRPRLLVHGNQGMGQQYIGAAILHHLEGFHVQSLDLGTLLSDPARTPEASVVQLLVEVKRHKPSVILIPDLDVWFRTMPDTVKSTFMTMLKGISPSDQVLVLGLIDSDYSSLSVEAKQLFGYSSENRYELLVPNNIERKQFFKEIFNFVKSKPIDFPDINNRPKRVLENLPLAPKLDSESDSKTIIDKETLNMKAVIRRDLQLKNALKVKLSVLMDLIKTRYKRFRKPAIDDAFLTHLFETNLDSNVHFRYERSKNDMILDTDTRKLYYNMDLDHIEDRLWNGYYCEPKEFLRDVELIHHDANVAGDRERMIKAAEMCANVQVTVDEISLDHQFVNDCKQMHQRELLRRKYKLEQDLLLRPEEKEDDQANGMLTLTNELIDVINDGDKIKIEEPIVEVAENTNNSDVSKEKENACIEDQAIFTTTEAESIPISVSPPKVNEVDDKPITDATKLSTDQLNLDPILPEIPVYAETDTVNCSSVITINPPVSKELELYYKNLEELKKREVVISDDKLASLEKLLVSSTEDFVVEELEQLNSALLDVAWKFKELWDRNIILDKIKMKMLEVIQVINEIRGDSFD